jgi:hypothetical protein
MELVERRLSDLSRITHQFWRVEDGKRDTNIQVISFSGEYGVGSKGNNDAAYMRGVVLCGLASWDVSCLILDLSDLEYSWGYALLGVIEVAGEFKDQGGTLQFPVFIVVSDRCKAGITSLLASAPESFGNIIFDSVEKAMARAKKAMGEYLDMTDPSIKMPPRPSR